MSWVRIWIHLVFSTKNKKPFLKTLEIRKNMFDHISENAKKKNIWLDRVGGYSDHVHCLISLGRNQSLSEVSQLIKGESSHWINKSGLLNNRFVWQDDYHSKKSFSKEIDVFMKKFGWQLIKNSKSSVFRLKPMAIIKSKFKVFIITVRFSGRVIKFFRGFSAITL